MGVDFSHGGAHPGRRSFHSFRRTLVAMVGLRLDEMLGFGGTALRETVAGPLAPPPSRNNADGEPSPDECRARSARLQGLMADEHDQRAVRGDRLEDMPAGMKGAAEVGAPFVIMG
jgi:hypothetical protein